MLSSFEILFIMKIKRNQWKYVKDTWKLHILNWICSVKLHINRFQVFGMKEDQKLAGPCEEIKSWGWLGKVLFEKM